MMQVHRLQSLPAEQSGIMKQSERPLSHMLTVSLCPLSLCIMGFLVLSFGPFSSLSASRPHALSTCHSLSHCFDFNFFYLY